MVFAPPRHSKSLHVAQGLPAWWLGRRPADSVILSSYSAELAEGHSRRARGFMLDPRFPFPGVAVSQESAAVGRWHTTAGGGVIAAGVGGGITGFGADLLVADDLVKGREEADSPAIREATWRWWTEVALTRLQPRAVMLLTATRWHEDDVPGRVLSSPGAHRWTVLTLPALAEENDPLGRAEGEALWPAWFPRDRLLALRAELGERAFLALYQQRPTSETGGIFRRDWLAGRWSALPPTGWAWPVVQAVDASFGKGVGSDWSAILTVGTLEGNLLILDARRGHWEFSDLVAAIRSAAADWSPGLVLVEDSAAGQSAVQELRRLSDLPVVAVSPRGSKVSRAESVQSLFASGRVLFPANAGSWRDELVEELAAFPAGRHDDMVDALVYALACLRASSSPGRAPTVGGREESSLVADLGSPTWKGTGRLDEGLSADMSF